MPPATARRHPAMNIHARPGESSYETSTTTARAPTAESAEITARTVEVHLRNGNWELAHNVLNCAEREFRRAMLHRTPQDWLDGDLLEFKLPERIENIFVSLDIHTMRGALEFLNTGAMVEQLGPVQSEVVWRAAAGKGIDFPRSELATTAAVAERQRKQYVARSRAKQKAKRTAADLEKSRRRFHQPVVFSGQQ